MIENNRDNLHLILDATNDGYFDYNIVNGKIDISRTWLNYLGYSSTEKTTINMDKVLSGIVNSEKEEFSKAIDEYLLNNSEIFYKDIRAYKAERGYIWILVRGKIIEYDKEGKPVRFVGSLFDITRSKENELKNVYLLQTDPVTTLKNRAYMENKIREIDSLEIMNFCVIMADVNGLKLMNDAFGHKEGDRLLNTVGEIIRLCCSDTDIPVRWGGDEFLILIRNSRKYADLMMKKVKQELNQISSFPIKISLAMGCSAIKGADISIEQAICRAEEKMYRNKLLETRSFHNGVIASFEQTLYEKKIENLENISRRKKLCQKTGEMMNLSPEERDELELLNLLHDVGEISMPDYIITGKKELSDSEWTFREKHVEAGYRIAKAIPEIAHIANSILCHHENFDGSGYPSGIEEENIPLIARIFAVVNFYVSKTNEINTETSDLEEIRMELEHKSGKQFDPKVVEVFLRVIAT